MPWKRVSHTVAHPVMPTASCDLLVLDLDGTLLDPASRISSVDHEAVVRAMDAGIEVVVCTGRGHAECKTVLETIGVTAPAVVAGGAMTVEPATGRTINRSVMELDLVREVSAMLNSATGHYVLLLKDRWTTGIDYVLLGDGRIDPASEWWFDQVAVNVHRAESLDHDPHPHETVRLGIVTTSGEMKPLAQEVIRAFGERVFIHDFPVISSDGNGRHLADKAIHLMEIFNLDTNKWSAVAALAAQRGIETDRIAAVGDEINDVSMIRHAGIGIAMGNAVEPIKQIADRITLRQSEGGVAHAIDHLLAGTW